MENYPIWIRLHPDSLDETMAISVQARIHDPLWLLGRQWQLAELRHDAGATPIDVRVDGTSAPIARMRGGPADAIGGPYVTVAPKGAPLETIVEREAVSETGLDGLRLRTDAGLHLLRMLRAAGLTAPPAEWVARCPFVLPAGVMRESLDGETRNWWDLVDGRVPDAAKLKTAVPAALSPPAGTTPVPAAEADVLRAWLKWFGSRFEVAARGASTWDPERFEYSFAVSGLGASGEVVLASPEYVEGRLDWFDFEQASGSLGVTGQPVQRRSHRIPAPLDFIGMPNPRFWTFEDPSLRFDALELLSRPDTPPSPATLMVLDFALSYGDDWFLVPLAMDAWTVFQATEIAVTDVFGDTAIANHPQGRWNLFRLEAGTTTRSGLSAVYLNASAAETVEGPPLEELHLLRDEVANVAWAVERLVPHPLNHSVDPPAPSAAGAAGPTGLVWTLAPPSPPRNWFPLLPTEIGRLALGVLWSARDARPAGTLLAELRASKRRLHQEEVPNEGAQVSRRWQSARGSGGSLHFWIGRSKTPRKTDIAPAVRFDLVEWR